MSIRSLKQTLDRMVHEKRGVGTAVQKSGDLQQLKVVLDNMYAERNAVSPTYCPEHKFASYAALQTSLGYNGDEYSTGDYNRALDNMTYCTCESRFAAACNCENRIDNVMVCECNARNNYTCDCQWRSGGKYGPPPCVCDLRVAAVCGCRERESPPDCTCDGRCSCNAVKEFSMTPPNDNCTCNGVYQSGCACQSRSANTCDNHVCSCRVRDAAQVGMSQPYPGWHCSTRVKTGYYLDRCSGNTCTCFNRTATVATCSCDNRCSCNTKQIIT